MVDDRAVESWTWFAFATLIVIMRYISRAIRLGGIRYFELEDYVMVLAYGFYTALIVLVNIQEQHPRTNILPPTGLVGIDQDEVEDRILGSKLTFALEESMVMIQFLCKICMCLLFFKLTSGLKRQLQVKILIAYVIIGWLVTEIFFFGIWCRPFMNYFRVMENIDPGCSTSQHHLIMSFAFNLSSDVLMLTVPIPMLLQSQLPIKQKITITGVFSLGIFVIISATLSRYYCFAHPESILWIYWYVREASTAIMVSNIPHLYSFLRKAFDIETFSSLRRRNKPSDYMDYAPSGGVQLMNRSPTAGCGKKNVIKKLTGGSSKGSSNKGSSNKGSQKDTTLRSESTENFASHQPLQIWQRNEYSVNDADATEAHWDEGDSNRIWNGGLGTKATVVSTNKTESPER